MSPATDPRPHPTPPQGLPAGKTPEDALRQIFSDMMNLTDEEIDGIESKARESGDGRPLEAIAEESGFISAEERDQLWPAYVARRVAEMRAKLLGTRVGSYQILEEIAAGGMGIVFKARQESPMFTRETALKFMLAGPEARQETRDRFVNEVKALASLSHPGLVSIYDSGIEGDLYYFSMELIDGWSLDDAEKARALPFARKVELVRDVARALAYLHEKGVIHRDVKPGNIMVDRHGRARLLDFGIAQFSTDARRRAAQAGTPYFMAPEVVAPTGGFGPIGAATDVYALGAVLYQILFSRPVFESDNGLGVVLARTLHEPPSFPKERGSRIPPDLQAIIGRCLRKRAGERYSDGANVAGALDDFLRRSRFRLPAWAAAGVLLAGAVLLTLSAREGTEKAQVRAAEANFRPWRDRIQEIGEVDATAARPLEDQLAAIATRSEAGKDVSPELQQLSSARSAFWQARVTKELTEAEEAKGRYLGIEVAEDERLRELFRSANGSLEQAKLRRADRTAYDLLQSARKGFVDGRAIAEAALAARKARAEENEAETARAHAIEARDEVEKEDPLSAAESTGEAARRWKAALAQIEAGDARLRDGTFGMATQAFRDAQQAFFSTRALARAEFGARRTLLASELEQTIADHSRSEPRLAAALDAAAVQSIGRLRANAEQAAGETRLGDLAAVLEEYRSALSKAKTNVDGLEKAATEARERARANVRGPIPAPMKADLLRAKASLESGNQLFRSGAFDGARTAFDDAAQALDAVRRGTKTLTEGMAWIPQGASGFWIDRTEVSVRRYGERRTALPRDWERQRAHGDHPVVGVTFEAAQAFARASGKELPTEAEWKAAAARAPDKAGSPWPFGDTFDAHRVNGAGAEDGFPELAPVDSLPSGATRDGCLHLSGNAAEWVVAADGQGVLMGGSYLTGEPEWLRGDARYLLATPFEAHRIAQQTAGFRCVLRALKEASP